MPATKTKLRGRSFVVNGSLKGQEPRWYVSARLHTDGEIAWVRCGGGAVVEYTPTAKDWQALAVKMAERMDATDEEIEQHLADMQKPAATVATAVTWAAEMADATQCADCDHWSTDHSRMDDGDYLCLDCLENAVRDACRCGRRDCGDCGRTAPVGPYD